MSQTQSRNSSGPPRRRYQKPEEVWIPKTSIGKRVVSGEITLWKKFYLKV